ncbi:MAG: glutamine synthetase family protein [Treponema sp.]|nr:glutamine synthetase family protein [Treponema sp.]
MAYTETEVLQYIEENDVKFIKLFFTDVFGTVKSISIQPGELQKAFATGISFDASAIKGFLEADNSDLFIVPDPDTLCVLPWRPQMGRVVRFFCDIKNADGTPFIGDTRYLLRQTAEKAAQLGYEIDIGTECEFYLFQNDVNGNATSIPQDEAGYCDLAPLDKGENVRRDICLTLKQMNIEPEKSHHESGPGQHEIDFKYDSLMTAGDNLVTFKTVVSTIAVRNGLSASFDPVPVPDKPGNGLHINISLKKNGHNIFDNPVLPDEAKYFIAGIMKYIREMTVFLNPKKDSYTRLGRFEAPKYVTWSTHNRSQLIRIPSESGERKRLELRSPDASCNPYLGLALIINAGLVGIQNKLPLDKAVDCNLYKASEAETKNLQQLPASFAEALELAKKSDFIASLLSSDLINAFATNV